MSISEISFDLTLEEEDADAHRLDELTLQLRHELLDFGLDSVERSPGEPPPEGSKGDPFTLGALALVVAPAVLTNLVSFLQAWTLRGDGRKVKIKTAAGAEIEFIPEKRLSENEILALFDQLTSSEAPAERAQEVSTPPGLAGESTLSERYIDFDLHIAPDGHAVASSPFAGEAESKIPLAVPRTIEKALGLIEARHTTHELLTQVGCAFYDWLFPGPIHTHFHQTEAVARREHMKVRLRLRIEPEAIARLPLELLYRATSHTFMAINPNTVVSRYLNLALPPGQVRRRKGPLHMLAIIADPADQTRLPPDEWEVIIKEALAKPIASGLMTMQIVKRAARREIRDAMLAQKPNIIQFIGHGIFKDGQGYLALVNEVTGKTWRVDEEQFANLYMGHDDDLGLISLATCESAMSDNPQGFVGIAPRLVQRGVPAVLSMQYKVYIDTAKVFLEDFYTAISAGKPIDWATQSARNAVALDFGLDHRDFATPVLYMRAEDGNVF